MKTVLSQDGTAIAFDRSGSGDPVILVDGALCYRSFGPMGPLSALLAPHFTVYTYDRRGRGDSGDKAPYAIDREVEDIAALIDEAGGSAFVYGISSGAALALEAAVKDNAQIVGRRIKKLALYEPPFIVGGSRALPAEDYMEQFHVMLASGRRGDMVEHFMINGVGMPAEAVAPMRGSPAWPMLEAVAPTLIYDTRIMEDNNWLPNRHAANVRVPTLVMSGGASPAWMQDAAQALAETIPGAQARTLAGQTHDAAAEAVVPALIEFFKSE